MTISNNFLNEQALSTYLKETDQNSYRELLRELFYEIQKDSLPAAQQIARVIYYTPIAYAQDKIFYTFVTKLQDLLLTEENQGIIKYSVQKKANQPGFEYLSACYPLKFTDLPLELQLSITQYLSLTDLANLFRTCQSLATLTENNEVWKAQFLDELNPYPKQLEIKADSADYKRWLSDLLEADLWNKGYAATALITHTLPSFFDREIHSEIHFAHSLKDGSIFFGSFGKDGYSLALSICDKATGDPSKSTTLFAPQSTRFLPECKQIALIKEEGFAWIPLEVIQTDSELANAQRKIWLAQISVLNCDQNASILKYCTIQTFSDFKFSQVKGSDNHIILQGHSESQGVFFTDVYSTDDFTLKLQQRSQFNFSFFEINYLADGILLTYSDRICRLDDTHQQDFIVKGPYTDETILSTSLDDENEILIQTDKNVYISTPTSGQKTYPIEHGKTHRVLTHRSLHLLANDSWSTIKLLSALENSSSEFTLNSEEKERLSQAYALFLTDDSLIAVPKSTAEPIAVVMPYPTRI
jgi:hypothetical protein